LDGPLRGTLEHALGARIGRATPVHGGDVATSYRVELDDERVVFAKTHASPPPGFFTTEAAGLRWLAEAGAVAVPAVVAVDDGDDGTPPHLVLEWIEEGHPTASTDPQLGVELARVHGAGAPSFGREDRRSTGSRGLPNDPCDTWAEFYATRRLAPLARLAADAGALPAGVIGAFGRLADGFDRVAPPVEPPARLHGDLWAGNRLVDATGRNWLIDPACFGGHREFDLAMMRLFGGFGPSCFERYAEVAPLVDGWEERVALHQIAPLVVHAIKFGGGYVAAASAAITRYASAARRG